MTDEGAQALQAQGVKLYEQHDYEAAARLFRKAQEAYEESEEKMLAAEMRTNIGLVHRALGQHQLALDEMQAAHDVFVDAGDLLRTAQVLGNMGGVYLAIGDKEQAYNCYRQAADHFEALGERVMYGETMVAMAKLQFKDGKIWPAAATYEVGLENLDHLSFSQKILKRLIGVRNRLTGGGAGDAAISAKDDDGDDKPRDS